MRKDSNVNKIIYAVPFHLMENIGLENNINYMLFEVIVKWVNFVLHPHGIASTF